MPQQQPTTPNQPVSLDSVFSTFKHWRANKDQYDGPGIPADIWHSIFQLEQQGYSKSELCRVLGLNSQQYNKKRNQFYPATDQTSTAEQPTSIDEVATKKNSDALFSEAIVAKGTDPGAVPSLTLAAEQTKQVVRQLKSTNNQPERYLDTTTIIVECIRPDGHRLKIHTTNQRLDVVMQSFLQQGVVAL